MNDEYKFKKNNFREVLDSVFKHNKKNDLSIEEIIDKFDKININKRKRVKVACINCKNSHQKCDNDRPCKCCIKRGLSDTCKNLEKLKNNKKSK